MTTASERDRDRKHALTLWEMARSAEPVTFDFFARLVGAVRGTEAGKRAFYRFGEWCRERGVSMEMDENVAAFDREKAMALALKVNPALRPRPPTREKPAQAPPSAKNPLDLERDPLVAPKRAAALLGISLDALWRMLRRKPPEISFVRLGRRKAIRMSAIEAWIARHTVKGQETKP